MLSSGQTLQQCGIVVSHIAHPVADRPSKHLFGRVGTEQVYRRSGRVSGRQPAGLVSWFENHRHPIMNWSHQFIPGGGQNREGLQRRPVLWPPALPQSGEGIRIAALQPNREWALRLWIEALPLEKCVRRHETAPLLQRLSEGGLRRNLFSTRIDRVVADLGILRSRRHQAPAHQRELPVAAVVAQAHNWLNALRSDIKAGRKPRHVLKLDTKPVGEDFLR
jgi:hypothetical protein